MNVFKASQIKPLDFVSKILHLEISLWKLSHTEKTFITSLTTLTTQLMSYYVLSTFLTIFHQYNPPVLPAFLS